MPSYEVVRHVYVFGVDCHDTDSRTILQNVYGTHVCDKSKQLKVYDFSEAYLVCHSVLV